MTVVMEGKFFVCAETGEVINHTYEQVNTVASAEDKRYYSATSVCPNEATDKGQIVDFIKHTVDKRKLKTLNVVKEYKKESDFNVRTLKQKAFMSNPQYEVLNVLADCVVFKNIVLEEKKTLASKLGVGVNNLDAKLKTVSQWVVQDKECKKGFIKLLINPDLVFRAEHGRIKGMQQKALVEFHTVDKETQYNALYVPFVGPIAPYKAPEWSEGTKTSLDGLQAKLAAKWATKVFDEEDIQFEVNYTISAYEQEFVNDYYNQNPNSKFHVSKVPQLVQEVVSIVLEDWEPDYNSMPEYE